MSRAQAGDGAAYRDLLEEIAPYLRGLAAEERSSADQLEEFVHDVLRTVHAIRKTYDPMRPFEPWLVTIARRRLVALDAGDSRLGAPIRATGKTWKVSADPWLAMNSRLDGPRKLLESLKPRWLLRRSDSSS
nr:sigma factor [Variovorax sp. dw_308]